VILVLWWTSIFLQVAVCARVIQLRLAGRYPLFSAYIGALAVESVILLQALHRHSGYRKTWVITRAVLLCLEFLAVLEIFRRWSTCYPGIGKFGQGLLIVLLVSATGFSVASVPISWSSTGWTLATYIMGVANRAVQTGLAAFLLLMLGFFVKFGGPVPPNLKRHTWAMTAFISANTVGYFLLTSGSGMLGAVGNVLLPAVSSGSLIYWIFVIRGAGEQMPVVPDNSAQWAEAEELNRQLLTYADSFKQSRARTTEP
jgi:hypothetical protein